MSTSYKFDEKTGLQSVGALKLSKLSESDGVERFTNMKGERARETEKERMSKSSSSTYNKTRKSRKEQNRKTNMAHSKKSKAKQEALAEVSAVLEVAEHALKREEKEVDQSLSDMLSCYSDVMKMTSSLRRTRL